MTDPKLGDRVHVKGHWNWPEDCAGVVSTPPVMVQGLAGQHPWRGHIRAVPGRLGLISFVWVTFDEPQRDGDGDGPYRGGEVELQYVTRVGEQSP